MMDILDIEGITRFPWTAILTLLAVAGGALVLLTLFILLLRWWAKKRELGRSEELLPPHRQALLELDRLERQGFLEKGEFRKYYTFLSEIFRRYLEERYGYPALEKTTSEMMPDLTQKMEFSKPLGDLAETFLKQADLVKFARFQPSIERGRQEKERIVEFVKATMIMEGEKKQVA